MYMCDTVCDTVCDVCVMRVLGGTYIQYTCVLTYL